MLTVSCSRRALTHAVSYTEDQRGGGGSNMKMDLIWFLVRGETESTRYLGHTWSTVTAPDDDYECAAVGGVRIGRGNQSTRRKCSSMPFYALTHNRTRAGAVGSRRDV
jgi:hypothetical protein